MNNSFTSLSNQYNDLLNKYKQTYKKYLNTIRDGSNNPLVIVPNYSFFCDGINHSITSNSAQDCLNSCFSNGKCSGASYLSDSKKCILGEGQGSLLPTTNNMESAIVFTSLKLSYDLKYLNQQLLDLNKKISDSLEKTSLENQNITNHNITNHNVKKNYTLLLKEREKINQIVLEEEQLISINNNSQLVVTQEYSYYIVYLLVVLLILFLFIQFFIHSFASENSSNNSFRQRGGRTKR